VRILLVTNDYPPKAGGIQQYLGGLVAALPGPVRVLAPADGPAGGDVLRDRRRFMWPTRRVRRWIAAQIADFEPDLVLFGAPHPLAFAGPWLRRRTGVPYGVVCHGAEITVPAAFPLARQLVRHPLRRADLLVAVSQFTRRRVERLTGRPVEVIGAGIDPDFRPGPGPDSPPVLVGCVSRFVPRKGQDRVLRACARLRGEGLDVEVVMVGRGRTERRLRALAARLQVPTRFEVDLEWGDLPAAYRRMHVFAMPCRSRWLGLEAEGFGVVFLEAAASGLPVVAGDSGGAPETVEPGATGFVVSSPAGLVDALRRLVTDSGLRVTMGRAGRERAADRYTWEAVVERLEAALERVLDGPA
jgi:phosphatidylinositol alpha-1,6-mannosyltransferase